VLCSRVVGARKVFQKDPNLDYEIMSDEEWEEEPEGEDIIDNDADDDEGVDEEEEEDGSFMVAGADLPPVRVQCSSWWI
jgi:Chromatin assembly factor 1 subunit A